MATDPRPSVGAPPIAPEPAEASGSTVQRAAAVTNGAAPAALSGDPLAQGSSICPYLRSADGSHRALAASREHRCWAVDPAQTIPSATQADLCLAGAHGRCERYVAARSRRATALATEHVPHHLVTSPRFAIPVDPVPVVMDSRASGRDQGTMAPGVERMTRGRLTAVGAGVGVLVLGIIGFAALFGGMGRQPGPTPPLLAAGSISPTAGPTSQATAAPSARPAPTSDGTAPLATEAAVVVPQTDPTPRPQPSYPVAIRRTYVVKEGDTYRTLAKRFGLKPRDLRALNGPLKVGERILIPAEPWVTDAPGD